MQDVLTNEIENIILSALKARLHFGVSESEVRAFKNSLPYMSLVLGDDAIPDKSGIFVEYQIPQTGKRVDFIITGTDAERRSSAVLIELKQWSEAVATSKDGVVETYLGKRKREVVHPCYQAWSYSQHFRDFNEEVYSKDVQLNPCAYLHNYRNDGVINDARYAEWIEKAPLFLKEDAQRLREFIKKFVKHGDDGELMYRIDNGRIRPSKNLADSIVSLLNGNREFIMLDDQKVVYETAMSLARNSRDGEKNVLIVEGGPGTGKSVVAVNLLVALTGEQKNARYVTMNAAPRDVFKSKLLGTIKKSKFDALFSSSGVFHEADGEEFDVLIVDESHRLREKSGIFKNKGENQVAEIIAASRLSLFFLDENQQVTWSDIGTNEEIERWAKHEKAKIHRLSLLSQFRCNGADGYLPWLDEVLQIRPTANMDLSGVKYDFRVVDSPVELHRLIKQKNKESNKARVVAGYCWNWVSKDYPMMMDVVMPEYDYAAKWNLLEDGNLWILNPKSVEEVGCIHTCQGLDVDYVGVIIGPDLIVRDDEVITHPEARAKTDKSLSGYKKDLKISPNAAKRKADLIIKNTYRTLMTRGMKGCYVFCTDVETREYFRKMIGNEVSR